MRYKVHTNPSRSHWGKNKKLEVLLSNTVDTEAPFFFSLSSLPMRGCLSTLGGRGNIAEDQTPWRAADGLMDWWDRRVSSPWGLVGNKTRRGRQIKVSPLSPLRTPEVWLFPGKTLCVEWTQLLSNMLCPSAAHYVAISTKVSLELLHIFPDSLPLSPRTHCPGLIPFKVVTPKSLSQDLISRSPRLRHYPQCS